MALSKGPQHHNCFLLNTYGHYYSDREGASQFGDVQRGVVYSGEVASLHKSWWKN